MSQDPHAHFLRQIETGTVVFQLIHDAEALLVMPEAFRQQRVQRSFSDMPVGRVAKIVPESDGFRQIFVQAEGTGQGPCNLGNLKRMGKPGPVMIPFRGKKNLRFEFQPAKRFAMDDTIPIPLKGSPQIAGSLLPGTACRFGRMGRIRGQQEVFLLLKPLAYVHTVALLSAARKTPNNYIQHPEENSCFAHP